MSFLSSFITEHIHHSIASTVAATTSVALTWGEDLLTKAIVGIVVGVGTWLITQGLSSFVKWVKNGPKP